MRRLFKILISIVLAQGANLLMAAGEYTSTSAEILTVAFSKGFIESVTIEIESDRSHVKKLVAELVFKRASDGQTSPSGRGLKVLNDGVYYYKTTAILEVRSLGDRRGGELDKVLLGDLREEENSIVELSLDAEVYVPEDDPNKRIVAFVGGASRLGTWTGKMSIDTVKKIVIINIARLSV